MAEEAAKGPGRKSVLKHVDTVGALPSLECGRGRGTAAKKLSHPGPGPVSTNPKINIEASPRRGFTSTFLPCIAGADSGKKKVSKEAASVSAAQGYDR